MFQSAALRMSNQIPFRECSKDRTRVITHTEFKSYKISAGKMLTLIYSICKSSLFLYIFPNNLPKFPLL